MQRSGCLQEGQRNVQMRIRRVDKHGNWSECKIWKKCGSTEMVSEVAYELKIYNQRNTEGLLPGFLKKLSVSPSPKQEGYEGPLALYVCSRNICIHLSCGRLLYLIENDLVWDGISLTYLHGLLCEGMNHYFLRNTSSFSGTEKEVRNKFQCSCLH